MQAVKSQVQLRAEKDTDYPGSSPNLLVLRLHFGASSLIGTASRSLRPREALDFVTLCDQ